MTSGPPIATVKLLERQHVAVHGLAYGEQRQLEVGLALAGHPKILLLDEPTAGMSPAETAAMIALLAELPRTITLLIVEHDMDVVFALADIITVLHLGEVLAEGAAAAIQSDPAVPRRLSRPTRERRMMPLLAVNGIHTYYGESHVLQGVSLSVDAGQVVALLGRNGVGKTTTIQTILGLPAPRAGDILLREKKISGRPTYEIVRSGIGWVPQGHRIFPDIDGAREPDARGTVRPAGRLEPRARVHPLPESG